MAGIAEFTGPKLLQEIAQRSSILSHSQNYHNIIQQDLASWKRGFRGYDSLQQLQGLLAISKLEKCYRICRVQLLMLAHQLIGTNANLR